MNKNAVSFNSKLSGLLLGLWLSVVSAHGATITAASVSLTDVANAVNAAATGDTVQIPAGTATWSSKVTVSKAITITGAGTNQTIITGQPWCFAIKLSSAGGLTRISNMQLIDFLPYSGSQPDLLSSAGGYYTIDISGPCTFRIDHVYFKQGCQQILTHYGAYGVVDHCVFEDPGMALRIEGNYSDFGWNDWKHPITFGDVNSVCVEDNLFIFTPLANNGLGGGYGTKEIIYHQWGGRSTIRYNVFDTLAYTSDSGNANAGWTEFIDCHGNQGYRSSDSQPEQEESTVKVEVYSNVFKADHSAMFSNQRGGCGMWYSNQFINVRSPSGPTCMLLVEEEGWREDFFSPLRTSWPAQMGISNSFFWANTYNGSPVAPRVSNQNIRLSDGSDSGLPGYESVLIQQDRDFWLAPPSASNGRPVGIYASYKPLVHPHPLISGSGPSTNPVISIAPSSLDYGTVAIGSTNDRTFTVLNAGMGILAGSASVPPGPFSIIGSSSYSLGSNASQTITIRYIPPPSQAGVTNQVVTFTGGGGATASVTGRTALGSSFDSTDGTITAPFVVNSDNTISQSVETADPTQGGEAVYAFSVSAAGGYTLSASVYAPDTGANSFFVNIDAEPTTTMVWDIPTYAGFTNRFLTWGTNAAPQVWTLSAGTHQLIVRGREAGVELGQIFVHPLPPSNLRLVGSGN